MDTVTSRLLFEALRDCRLYTREQIAIAEQILTSKSDQEIAERLQELKVLVPYQYRKIRAGRTVDLLFGRYFIQDKLGEGGMGKVFLAVEVGVGRSVALKTVRPQLMSNPTVLKRYQREAKATGSLNHPNIVTLYDADFIDGKFFLAMEYVDGIDLSRIVKHFGRPPERGLDDFQEACEYIRQASLGLQCAHDRGLVHRDIKPSNLLVAGDRPQAGTKGQTTVKILDMGLVRTIAESDDASRTELTRDGTVVGTPDYMAPEQAKNSSSVDHRADMYALGCTLYYMLRGQSPFPDGNPIDKLIRHQIDPPPDLRRSRPDVPIQLVAIIERLLQKKPDDRIQTARELAELLAQFSPAGIGSPTLGPSYLYVPVSIEPDAPTTPPTNPDPADAPTLGHSQTPPSTPVSNTGKRGTNLPAPRSHAGSGTISSPGSTVGATPASGITNPPSNRSGATSGTKLPRTRPPGSESEPPPPAPRSAVVRVVVPAQASSGQVVEAEVVHSPSPKPLISAPPDPPPSDPKIRRPHPPRGSRSARRRREAKQMWWKLAGGMAVGALLIIGLIVARPSRKDPDTNPTQSTQPQTLSTKSTTGNNYANLPPAGQMFPPGTVAAAVVYPQPFWKFKELKPDGELVKFIESIAGRSKFDPRLFDRGTTSFSASPGVYTATGEGRFLTPEWEAGLKTMNAKEVEPPPRAPERMKLYGFGTWTTGPRFATLIEGRAYAVSSDIQRLAALYRSLEGKIGPKLATLDPELLAAFPAPTDSDLPIVTFVSTGTWVFPDGKSLTLDKHGVQFLSVNLRLRNEFEGTILLVGSDKNKLKDFISLVLITNLVSQYPALKPLALELGRRYETAPAPLANGLYRMTINVTFSRGDLVNAIEGLLAPAP